MFFYAQHVMSKRKYIDVRTAGKTQFESVSVPNLVSYGRLSEHISNIDMDIVKDISCFVKNIEG